MSDFSRVMEIALAAAPEKMKDALGTPPPSLAEQMAANEAASTASAPAAISTSTSASDRRK